MEQTLWVLLKTYAIHSLEFPYCPQLHLPPSHMQITILFSFVLIILSIFYTFPVKHY